MPGSRAGQFGAIQQIRAWRVSMKSLFVRFVREEKGQDLIEYSLLAAIIAVGSIVAMGLVGDEIDAVFDDVVTGLQTR